MNRSFSHGSLLQQVVVGSPSWWSMNSLRPSEGQQSSLLLHEPHLLCQEPPQSWSQLLLDGLVGEEKRYSLNTPFKRELDLEEQLMKNSEEIHPQNLEKSENCGACSTINELQVAAGGRQYSWSNSLPLCSPRSCITSSFSCNMLDFSNNKEERRQFPSDQSSEWNNAGIGVATKKARVQGSSSSQFSTFKVRKEKLGDRITALHQMVSPFGKTDTASVLLEAIGYIRFLQNQIEALCSPYLNTIVSGKTRQAGDDEQQQKDLRSRGLCLVPVSCTSHVDDDNDYWAPSIGGAFR